ncbi:hypothetical protein [Hydrogenophaga taeniospiralis]|uniref:hypothetical protein n=1 Tax=Hydrogenophaga taeniospiralis TaxID=65656 RepID=UPI001CFC24D1|nr:hypothetical protein [Hydrogenophaga taeniospiralis]UCU92657.1 hypothetical protein KI616_17710 [Hydrogenophaga taeniospiralis]
MSRAPTKPVQMACLSIGYQRLLLPADKAMKVVEALQHAVQAEIEFKGHRDHYKVQDEPLHVQFSLVSQSQISMPHGEPVKKTAAKPALLPSPSSSPWGNSR